MSAPEYASSKILPRFQNLRTNVNISVTLQDSSLEKLENCLLLLIRQVPIFKLRRRQQLFMWLLNYENNEANPWM
jgi:hypothetical protein